MKKNNSFQLNIGSSSILHIFFVLSLLAFSVLTLVSANSDWNLSNKLLTRTTAYYEACNQAEQSLHTIDSTLHTIYQNASCEESYFAEVGGETLSFIYSISDIQSLSLELQVLYPSTEKGPFYKITQWEVIITESLDYDESLHVFQ